MAYWHTCAHCGLPDHECHLVTCTGCGMRGWDNEFIYQGMAWECQACNQRENIQMIDITKPCEAVTVGANYFDVQFLGMEYGKYLFVVLPTSRDARVYACDGYGQVIGNEKSPGTPLRLRNKVRRVYVNFYRGNACSWWDSSAVAAANSTDCSLGIAVPVDLPL